MPTRPSRWRRSERTFADGLFINPVVGNTKPGDFVPQLILDGYQAMIDYGIYPAGKGGAGELHHLSSLCRSTRSGFHRALPKEHGLQPFHRRAGPFRRLAFYRPNAGRELFEELGDIGIEPVFFDAVGYDPQSERYLSLVACETARPISGTEIRRALTAGEAVPNWMMRSEVQDIVRADLTMKHALFQ